MSDDENMIVAKSGKLKLKSPKPAKPKKLTQSRAASPKLSTVAGTTAKETIYVDVDDEITAIIERVGKSKGGIIALVLPKRATVLQSVVNMRLLKRAAEAGNKNLVLVTSEASLLPLAGLIGMHVAETPSSKPAIPPRPDLPSDEPENVDEPLPVADNSGTVADEFDPDASGEIPVGELAGLPPIAASKTPIEEVIMDNGSELAGANTDEKLDVIPVKKNKKLAVPNFDKFRLRIALGVFGVIFLVVGWVVATTLLPKASVAIKTNSQVVKSNLNLTLDTAAKQLDEENKIIPATAQTQQKSYTQQVAATGQQNTGDKATGTVKFSVTKCAPDVGAPSDVTTGSSVTAAGKTFITQEKGEYSFNGASGSCVKYTTNNVNITALKAGAEYNMTSGTTFTRQGGTSGTGSTAGGTDNIVKVVAQADIDSAKSKIAAQDSTSVKLEMETALKAKGLLAITSTFLTGDQQVSSSASPGESADTITVTSVVPYTMLGIKQIDLQALVVANVEEQIDPKKQKILDNGVAKTVFTQQTPGTATSAVVSARVESVAGPELNVEDLKKQIAGKKANEIKQVLSALPGVTEVEVSYGPFWVSSAPKDTSKITVTIAKPTTAR
ncbi:hypothetical protein IPL85_00510 [Candidatus Saccharibacteria bacterium]|nr:MAG: hypothetical protein IPL85_00510 [Candidatus Saccharibacteria bacterium]